MLGIRDIASSRASKNWSLSSGAAQNVGAYTLTMVAGLVDVDNRRFRILSVPAVGGSMEVIRVSLRRSRRRAGGVPQGACLARRRCNSLLVKCHCLPASSPANKRCPLPNVRALCR